MNRYQLNKYIINSRNKLSNEICNNYKVIEENILNIINKYSQKENINLLVSYYIDKYDSRKKEIDLCTKLNCLNKLFNKIIIINETLNDIEFLDKKDSRIIIINNSNRLTFKNFFNYSNQYTDVDTINILINSDIIIGENFNKIKNQTINMDNKFFFLSRYEVKENFEININNDYGSFDTWVWKGIINSNIGDYSMGSSCCDVKLAYDFYENKYLLKNPSIDLKTYHIHLSNIRNYSIFSTFNGKMLKIKHSELNNIFSENDYHFFSYPEISNNNNTEGIERIEVLKLVEEKKNNNNVEIYINLSKEEEVNIKEEELKVKKRN
jgi:hypothetical protein